MKTLHDHRPADTLVGRWELDPQRSNVEFRVGHFWGLATVKGHFDEYEGRLDLGADPAIELTIDAASVQTGNPKRDAENHPSVQFVSDSVVLQGDTLSVRGWLFARDRSIPLELDARVRRVNGELEIEAATSAPHRELGMTWTPLRMIPPHSELHVTGYLVPAAEQAG